MSTPAPETATVCSARNLNVAYGASLVLENIDLDVPQGSVMGIIGPNGSGKSTLIKSLLGLMKPWSGEVTFFGQPLDRVRRRVGYMAQSTSVDWDFPTTVLDVVTMGTYGNLGWLRRPGKKERQAARQALELTGMSEFSSRQIGQLSGGQRQRVFLARALVQQPDLYFMDEPFQGVDAYSQQAIVDVLHRLRSEGKTIVLVHHDLATVEDYCDHITLINHRIVASGPVATTFTKANIDATYHHQPAASEVTRSR